jgi:hypothetical protein
MTSINLVLVEVWDEMNVVHRSDAEEIEGLSKCDQSANKVVHRMFFMDWPRQRKQVGQLMQEIVEKWQEGRFERDLPRGSTFRNPGQDPGWTRVPRIRDLVHLFQ